MTEPQAVGAPAEERAHSRFGGSIASRFMNCPGSVALCDTVPPKPPSKYAAEGTAAHSVGEHCLLGGEREAALRVGEWHPLQEGSHDVQRFEVTDEMATAVQVYLDAVYAELDASPDAELYVEQKFEFVLASAAPGEVFGKNDAMVYTPSKGRLVVFDYKHGAGVSVDVTDNKQLKFYAAGAVLNRPWALSEIELVIVQPRTRDAETEEHGGVKRWTFDPTEVLDFADELDAAVAAAKAVEQIPPEMSRAESLVVGSWCRWCDAAAVCPAREAQASEAVTLDYANVEGLVPSALPEPKTLDTARIGRILAGASIMRTYLDQVEEYAFGLLVQGVAVPGYKLVDKVGRRQWTDNPEEIAAYLELNYGLEPRDLMPPKLVTITEAERQLKAVVTDKAARKQALDDLSIRYTIKDSSGQTIAPESDRRGGIDNAARDFAGVDLNPKEE